MCFYSTDIFGSWLYETSVLLRSLHNTHRLSFVLLGIPFRNILSHYIGCSCLRRELVSGCLLSVVYFIILQCFILKILWFLVSVIVVMKLCCFLCFLFWPWHLQILKMGSMNRVSGCQLTTPPKVVFARSQTRGQTCRSLWSVCR